MQNTLLSLQSCGLAGDPPPRSQWLKDAEDFPTAKDHRSRLDALQDPLPCVRERISCFQIMWGVGKMRAGSLVPASSGFEPSLAWPYRLFPGRTAPWASNGALLARSSPVPGGDKAGADGLAGCCHYLLPRSPKPQSHTVIFLCHTQEG